MRRATRQRVCGPLCWAAVVAALLALRCHALLSYESHNASDAGADRQAPRPDGPLPEAGLDAALDLRAPDAGRDAAPPRDTAADAPADLLPGDALADRPAPDQPSPDLGLDASAADAGCGQTVMISELMIDPKGNDPTGEWFELYNGTAASAMIHGWVLNDKDASHTIKQPGLAIPAGGYLVLKVAKAALSMSAYTYSSGVSCATELCFANSPGDRLEIRDASGALVDQVEYTTAWPFASGASMSLRDPCLDNAAAASWCTEAVPYSSVPTNYGTPGAPPACK